MMVKSCNLVDECYKGFFVMLNEIYKTKFKCMVEKGLGNLRSKCQNYEPPIISAGGSFLFL